MKGYVSLDEVVNTMVRAAGKLPSDIAFVAFDDSDKPRQITVAFNDGTRMTVDVNYPKPH
jgi:hypothetical protein